MGTTGSTLVRKRGILVLGSYGRKNYGDDTFARVLSKYLAAQNVTVTFCNYKRATRDMVRRADLVVLGGGDVLQLAIIRQLERLVLPHKTCPIYAVGVSMPRPDLVSSGRLDIIDKFWCRFDRDVSLLQTRFPKHVHKISDLAVAVDVPQWQPRPRHIGLCLARPMTRGNEAVLSRQISHLIQQLHSRGWHVNWLSFNRDPDEDDLELFNMLTPDARRLTTRARGNLLEAMSRQSVVIAARFHANVFAHTIGVPVVSLETSRKIHEWNREYATPGIAMPRACDCGGVCAECVGFTSIAREIPIAAIMQAVNIAVAPVTNFSSQRVKICVALGQIAEGDYFARYVPPHTADRDTVYTHAAEIYFRYLRREITAAEFAGITCALVMGNPEHALRAGLEQAVARSQFDLHDAVDYMINQYVAEPQWNRGLWSNDNGFFSLSRTHQPRLEGVHRSGWSRVLDSLVPFHTDRGPIMDTFVDRTFGWHAAELEAAGMLPYREPWMGFIHHPPHAISGTNDCAHMVERASFQESLSWCEALFVMSTDLRDWLREYANRSGLRRLGTVPIHVVHHPIDKPDVLFTWQDFIDNPDRSLIQVGAWCRDPAAIFRIRSPIAKAALKTRDMDAYMRFSCDGTCRTVVDIDTLLPDQIASVRLIDFLPNEEYDRLLARNIVFLPLKSAVACNTLLECIARHTPVLVPRLPAVEEYLGVHYPLYYDDEAHAERLIADDAALRGAHEYLRTYNTDHLSIQYFADTVREALTPRVSTSCICGSAE